LDVGLRGCNFVLVGGATGMGFSTAENLAADGPNVALLARDADRATEKAGRPGGFRGSTIAGPSAPASMPRHRATTSIAPSRARLTRSDSCADSGPAGPMKQQGPLLEHGDDY
jgi:3-oxoacyl-[acyl-carrier protein] reductase